MDQDISTAFGGITARLLRDADTREANRVLEDALDGVYSVMTGVGAGLLGRLTPEQMVEIIWAKVVSLGLNPDQIQQLGQQVLSLAPQEG